jgi:flagellar biosynthesis/type III secretory pathway M-ring protein FliF/YscJ
LTMRISGMPGDKVGFVFDQRTWLMIGVGAVGLILIGLGIFLFLRDRKLRKLEDDFEGEGDDTNADALGEDRDSIMDAIITLDDQFKAGDISKEAYEKRRDELKDRLKNLA